MPVLAQKEILQSDTGKSGLVVFQRYDTAVNPKKESGRGSFLKTLLNMSSSDSLKEEKHTVSGKYEHRLYQQYYHGFKVLGGTYATHSANGVIVSVNGFFQKVGNPEINAKIDEATAIKTAIAFVSAKKYGWEDTFTQSLYKEQKRDSGATLYPKGGIDDCI